jgi:methylenetetrahydrofolate dehydrogenase (NADP+)/methenyltetrahydrofolate cyclohydrolase
VTKILDGKAVAAQLRAEVAEGVAELKDRGILVRLDVILVGDDPASATYVRMKQRDCEEVGIESRAHRFAADVSEKKLAALVEELNTDPRVSGFFIQLPLPERLDAMPLVSAIDPSKDVDGLSPLNAGRLSIGLPSLLPCTPHGVVQLLRRSGVEISGKETVMSDAQTWSGNLSPSSCFARTPPSSVCHSRTRTCRR